MGTRFLPYKENILENLNITTHNDTLAKQTRGITSIKTVRNNTVKTIIKEILAYAKDNKDVFAKQSKKSIMTTFINNQGFKTAKELDAYTLRGLKIAKLILVDGYSVNYEILTLSELEKLCKFSKSKVKAYFTEFTDATQYVIEEKLLIKDARVEKKTKVFSPTKAKETK